ncbi:MAG: hypothetical protein ACYS26_08940 [Planctomycetota bacterium]
MSRPGSAQRAYALREASAGHPGARRLCVAAFGDLVEALVAREAGSAQRQRARFEGAIDHLMASAPDPSTAVLSPELIATRAVRSYLAQDAARTSPEGSTPSDSSSGNVAASSDATPAALPAGKCPEAAALVDCLQALNGKQRMALKLILQRRFSVDRAARAAKLPVAEVRRLVGACLQTGVDRLRALRAPQSGVLA